MLGTAIVDPKAEEEPKEGRIVVFSIEDDGTRLEVVASKTVKNAVHAIAPFGESRIDKARSLCARDPIVPCIACSYS